MVEWQSKSRYRSCGLMIASSLKSHRGEELFGTKKSQEKERRAKKKTGRKMEKEDRSERRGGKEVRREEKRIVDEKSRTD